MNFSGKSLNFYTLAIFAPVLILTGVSGFFLPENLMSGAPAYNLFHIAFGLLGLALVFAGRESLICGFNLFFGMIDLYQAAASFFGWFPQRWFQWKSADDYLHIIIGALLVIIALYGFFARSAERD